MSARTLEEMERLLAERRRFEGWLAQLDARRESVPPHVYRRVHDDYPTRLTDVQMRLTAESGALRVATDQQQESVADLDRRLGAERDARAEAELRALVGEFSDEAWTQRQRESDAAIAELDALGREARAELDRLRELLRDVAPAITPATPVLGVPAADLAAPPEGIEVAHDGNDTPTAEADAAVDAEPADQRPGFMAAELAGTGHAGELVPAPDEPSAPPDTPAAGLDLVGAEELTPATPEPASARGADPDLAGGPDFDELAFLKSVVGRTTPAPRGRSSRPAAPALDLSFPEPPIDFAEPRSPAESASEPVPDRGNSRPSGAFGRPTPRTSEAVKSLRCAECGTLNFPTEWYCEKCGGELASF